MVPALAQPNPVVPVVPVPATLTDLHLRTHSDPWIIERMRTIRNLSNKLRKKDLYVQKLREQATLGTFPSWVCTFPSEIPQLPQSIPAEAVDSINRELKAVLERAKFDCFHLQLTALSSDADAHRARLAALKDPVQSLLDFQQSLLPLHVLEFTCEAMFKSFFLTALAAPPPSAAAPSVAPSPLTQGMASPASEPGIADALLALTRGMTAIHLSLDRLLTGSARNDATARNETPSRGRSRQPREREPSPRGSRPPKNHGGRGRGRTSSRRNAHDPQRRSPSNDTSRSSRSSRPTQPPSNQRPAQQQASRQSDGPDNRGRGRRDKRRSSSPPAADQRSNKR